MENNAQIARKLGFTDTAIHFRKKDDFFKNRPFIEAWYELEKRYLIAKSRCRDVAIEVKEKKGGQGHFALELYHADFFKSVESAANFLSCKVFYNSNERMPSSRHVLKLENIVKHYEAWRLKW